MTPSRLVRTYSTHFKGNVGVPIHFPFKFWEENVEFMEKSIKERSFPRANLPLVLELHEKRKALQTFINAQKAERNKNLPDLEHSLKERKLMILKAENELKIVEESLSTEAGFIPNISSPHSPIGTENKTAEMYIPENIQNTLFDPTCKCDETIKLKTHIEIAAKMDIFDIPSAARATGSGFYYWKNLGVFLELALTRYALDMACQAGFVPMATPELARLEYIQRCGFIPRTDEESLKDPPIYKLESSFDKVNSPQLGLIATAEIPLALYHISERLEEKELPKQYVAMSHCFRPELGSSIKKAGQSLYRVKQFTKVELFVLCRPQDSCAEFERLITLQKNIYKNLGFPFRVLEMATAELGASAYRKIDIEAWMPGIQCWGEISSASNCTDYQARRLEIRYRPSSFDSNNIQENKKLQFVHTLNATALAVPRIVIALMENFQNDDSTFRIPKVLHPYLPAHFIS